MASENKIPASDLSTQTGNPFAPGAAGALPPIAFPGAFNPMALPPGFPVFPGMPLSRGPGALPGSWPSLAQAGALNAMAQQLSASALGLASPQSTCDGKGGGMLPHSSSALALELLTAGLLGIPAIASSQNLAAVDAQATDMAASLASRHASTTMLSHMDTTPSGALPTNDQALSGHLATAAGVQQRGNAQQQPQQPALNLGGQEQGSKGEGSRANSPKHEEATHVNGGSMAAMSGPGDGSAVGTAMQQLNQLNQLLAAASAAQVQAHAQAQAQNAGASAFQEPPAPSQEHLRASSSHPSLREVSGRESKRMPRPASMLALVEAAAAAAAAADGSGSARLLELGAGGGTVSDMMTGMTGADGRGGGGGGATSSAHSGDSMSPPPSPVRNTGNSRMSEAELKRLKRKQSNRESARRSRMKKQAEVDALARSTHDLRTENSVLRSALGTAHSLIERLAREKAALLSQVRAMGCAVPADMDWAVPAKVGGAHM